MNKIKLFLLPFALAILSACNSNLAIMGVQTTQPKVETLDRAAAKPGEQVSFSGFNLTEGMDVLIGNEVVPIKILGNNLGTFTLPSNLPSGVVNVSFRHEGKVLYTMPIINSGTISNLPLTTADPSQICDDSLFSKPDGTIVRGSRICKPDLCTRDGQDNCLANPDFPAVSKANSLLPSNIKVGVKIAGVEGILTPYSLCTADGQEACITSPRYKAMDTDASVISEWDIRRGKKAGGISGKIEFMVNMVDPLAYDRAPTGLDVGDSIDDWANHRAFPTTNIPGFPTYNGSSFIRDPHSDTGAGVSANGVCDAGEDCVYIDRMTGLSFSPLSAASLNFDDSLAVCNTLVHGGYDDWRMPMQKEWYQAYINGFASISDALGSNRFTQIPIWTGTTVSGIHDHAYAFATFAGFVGQFNKGDTIRFHCVR